MHKASLNPILVDVESHTPMPLPPHVNRILALHTIVSFKHHTTVSFQNGMAMYMLSASMCTHMNEWTLNNNSIRKNNCSRLKLAGTERTLLFSGSGFSEPDTLLRTAQVRQFSRTSRKRIASQWLGGREGFHARIKWGCL